MKPTTTIYCLARNIGKPNETTHWEGQVKDVVPQLVKWLLATTMAKNIRIEVARNKADLGDATKDVDLLDMVDSIFDQVSSYSGEVDPDGN